MSKQVRLRRGTTVQHASFTGADGEVTVDTTKRVLVLHDGSTAGGKPLDAIIRGLPAATVQQLSSALQIQGGAIDTAGLTVDKDCTISGVLTLASDFSPRRFANAVETLTYAASVNLDFKTFSYKSLTLAGNVSFALANNENGRYVQLLIICDASPRTLTWPGGITFIGGSAPASIAASKYALLELFAFGTAVLGRYTVQP